MFYLFGNPIHLVSISVFSALTGTKDMQMFFESVMSVLQTRIYKDIRIYPDNCEAYREKPVVVLK